MVTEPLGCINQEGKLIPGSWKPSSPAPRWGLPTGLSQPPAPLPSLVMSFVSSCVCEGPSARPGPRLLSAVQHKFPTHCPDLFGENGGK